MSDRPEDIHNDSETGTGDFSQVDSERYRVFIEDVADGFYESNLNGDFIFFNEAFCRIFGYSRREMRNRNYREFMDEKNAQLAFDSINRVFRTGEGFANILWEITRKDGKHRILTISANLILNEQGEKTGFRGIARDITREKQAERSNQALFRIAKALPRHRRVNDLLDFIIREIQNLIGVEGASVILLDEEKKEFYFPVATYDDAETGRKMKEIRFPVDKGVAGQVYRTGQPMIVHDTSKSPYFFQQVDEKSAYRTRNMLDVPIRLQNRMIGVLCAVNKKEREFDQSDAFLLLTIASTVALPIENARINEELKRSYERVRSLNRAKDRVIHHLSHELKTPLSVLSATLGLLKKKLADSSAKGWQRPIDRMQRNLDRLLEMQYEIEDILRERDYRSYNMLSTLLSVCSDELEALLSEHLGETEIIEKIERHIEDLFGPREAVAQKIIPDRFADSFVDLLRPRFAHRSCDLIVDTAPVKTVMMPPDVLEKILEGLVRNAVENTPDGGRIEVIVRPAVSGPQLIVKDFGVGITAENQRLIFESNFNANATLNYASRKRFDFNAGGKGFDLLRMKIFSERYRFDIDMASTRCRFIPRDTDLCPGDIDRCGHCHSISDCLTSGGTTITVSFSA